MEPKSMVALVRKPRRWAVAWMSSQPALSTLSWHSFRRARSAKISAPPPGMEPSPAERRPSRTSSTDMPYFSA